MINENKLPVVLNDLTPLQVQYLTDDKHRFFVNPSGRRSRKTLIGKRRTLIQALKNPENYYFMGAPTHSQAKRIFWKDLIRDTHYLRKPGTEGKSETELKVTLKNGTEIWVIGLDKPERIEGTPWHGCHITEIGNCKETAWTENIYQALLDTGGWAQLDGVPEGINFYHDLALYAAGGALPISKPITGSYAENPTDPEWCYYHWFSSDVLPPEAIASAKMFLDERTYRQEMEGSFESYAGLAYYNFTDDNLANIEYNPDEHVHIGMDFNVDPMTATFNHIRSTDVLQFGEAYLTNSNTFEMRDHIEDLFPVDKCTIYPDATGRARESNATETDLAILRQAGFRIRAHSTNPRQKERVQAVTSLIRDGNGDCHYFVSPTNCPKTVNDLNKVVSLADGRLDRKQEASGLKHISDAEGYLIAYNFPIKYAETRTYS